MMSNVSWMRLQNLGGGRRSDDLSSLDSTLTIVILRLPTSGGRRTSVPKIPKSAFVHRPYLLLCTLNVLTVACSRNNDVDRRPTLQCLSRKSHVSPLVVLTTRQLSVGSMCHRRNVSPGPIATGGVCVCVIVQCYVKPVR